MSLSIDAIGNNDVQNLSLEILLWESNSRSYYEGPKRVVRQQKTHLHGHYNLLLGGYTWRPLNLFTGLPSFYRRPQVKYGTEVNWYRDIMGRFEYWRFKDAYIDVVDGRLEKLMVQATDDVLKGDPAHTWNRTFIRSVGPSTNCLANWAIDTIHRKPKEEWNKMDLLYVSLRWIPACVAIIYLSLLVPTAASYRNHGHYDSFLYMDWEYAKIHRNEREGKPKRNSGSAPTERNQLVVNPVYGKERLLRPSILLKLKEVTSDGLLEAERICGIPREAPSIQYVFVAWTSSHFNQEVQESRDALFKIAEKAARRAQVPTCWISLSCMPEDEQLFEEEVYKISDIIRGAHSLAIALRAPRDHSEMAFDEVLKEWGRRMWCFPEVLLSPPGQPIHVYCVGKEESPTVLSKADFPDRAWEDAPESRQLMDHYIGTLELSRLELVTIALKCIASRTTQCYARGDIAYVLMGLLRRRPSPDKSDSAFQAFAKLSLANDSDKLLERSICIQPPPHICTEKTNDHDDIAWLATDDVWGCTLWDIDPFCQVAAVGYGDSIRLDGCRAAAIRWDRFEQVATEKGYSWKRWLIPYLIQAVSVSIHLGPVLVLVDPSPGAAAFGVFILVFSIIIICMAPYLTKIAYEGKIRDTQALLFGFEGYLDIGTIEGLIWGIDYQRLNWSTCASSLSRHSSRGFCPTEGSCHEEYEGRDPTDDPTVLELVQRASRGALGKYHIFTLVDTLTMTVSLLLAEEPPVVALACGDEGGMVRSVLCSYDWRQRTLYRECVLRQPTHVLNRMDRISQVNVAFAKPRT